MEDIRDYADDLRNNIPTIPVLLQSIRKAKSVVLLAHAATITFLYDNPYIVMATMYSVALVLTLDHRSSRAAFHLSYHSQSIVFAAYGLHEMYTRNTINTNMTS